VFLGGLLIDWLLQALGAGAQKMREMQAEFAQKIGALVKEKEELQRELLRVR